MLEKDLWEKFHKEGYNRFSLKCWTSVVRGGYSLNYLKKYCNRNFLSRLINHKKFAKTYGIDISEIEFQK